MKRKRYKKERKKKLRMERVLLLLAKTFA